MTSWPAFHARSARRSNVAAKSRSRITAGAGLASTAGEDSSRSALQNSSGCAISRRRMAGALERHASYSAPISLVESPSEAIERASATAPVPLARAKGKR
jgi:hypothetical protein